MTFKSDSFLLQSWLLSEIPALLPSADLQAADSRFTGGSEQEDVPAAVERARGFSAFAYRHRDRLLPPPPLRHQHREAMLEEADESPKQLGGRRCRSDANEEDELPHCRSQDENEAAVDLEDAAPLVALGFHGIGHVHEFAKIAGKTLDRAAGRTHPLPLRAFACTVVERGHGALRPLS